MFLGLFLIILGGWAFIPEETVPKGLWFIAVCEMMGLDLGGWLLLLILGAYFILKPWFDKQGLFGKAEEPLSSHRVQ